MRALFALALALMFAGAAQAQTLGEVLRDPPLYDLAQAPPYHDDDPPKAQKDDTALWVFVAAASADWAVTAVCFDIECSGPATKGFTTIDDPKTATSIGLLVDGAFSYVVREWVQPDHPKVAAALFYGAAVLRVVLVTHKIGGLRRQLGG